MARTDAGEIALTGDDLVMLSGEILERGLAQLEMEDDLGVLKGAHDKVMALKDFFRRQLHEEDARREAANNLNELRIWQRRKIARRIQEMQKSGQLAKRGSRNQYSANLDDQSLQTLDNFSITHFYSHSVQMELNCPEVKVEEYIRETREVGEVVTGAVYRLGQRALKGARGETNDLPTDTYRVIYADPPWLYGNAMPEGFHAQEEHYPVMTVAEIAALPVKGLAEDDAVLFLWVTSPILAEAFSIIEAWGFTYKASFVWDKVKHVMGHYNSVRHEFLLICTRGSCQPDVKKLFDSVVVEERTEHSRKPDVFRQMIDTLYPNGKRVELFARRAAEGWEAWGNEL